MVHADELVQRILFLEGFPGLQQLGRLRIGEDVTEIFKGDLALERCAHVDLKEAIAYCIEVRDYVSRDLFEKILNDEEDHIDWLETNLALIDKVGEQNYLQSQMGGAEE